MVSACPVPLHGVAEVNRDLWRREREINHLHVNSRGDGLLRKKAKTNAKQCHYHSPGHPTHAVLPCPFSRALAETNFLRKPSPFYLCASAPQSKFVAQHMPRTCNRLQVILDVSHW